MTVTLNEILAARERIAGGVEETPCPRSAVFSLSVIRESVILTSTSR